MAKKKDDTNIEIFPISGRTITALKKAGITKASDFQNYSATDLKKIEGLGPVLLLELKDYLKGAKIKLKKREPAAKKERKWDPRAREVALMIQKGQIQNYAQDCKMAGMLIQKFGWEWCMRVELPPHIQPPTLRYFFSGGQIAGWVEDYFGRFAVMKLVEEEKVVEPEPQKEYNLGPAPEWKPSVQVPKTLGEFLKQRKNNEQ